MQCCPKCLTAFRHIIDIISSQSSPSTEPASFISLLNFFESLALNLLPQQMTAKQIAHSSTELSMKHFGVGPWLPQEVQSALSLLVESFSVAFPFHVVVQVNTQVSVVLHYFHLFSQETNIFC